MAAQAGGVHARTVVAAEHRAGTRSAPAPGRAFAWEAACGAANRRSPAMSRDLADIVHAVVEQVTVAVRSACPGRRTVQVRPGVRPVESSTGVVLTRSRPFRRGQDCRCLMTSPPRERRHLARAADRGSRPAAHDEGFVSLRSPRLILSTHAGRRYLVARGQSAVPRARSLWQNCSAVRRPLPRCGRNRTERIVADAVGESYFNIEPRGKLHMVQLTDLEYIEFSY